jgi:hypothetical protein
VGNRRGIVQTRTGTASVSHFQDPSLTIREDQSSTELWVWDIHKTGTSALPIYKLPPSTPLQKDTGVCCHVRVLLALSARPGALPLQDAAIEHRFTPAWENAEYEKHVAHSGAHFFTFNLCLPFASEYSPYIRIFGMPWCCS